MSEPIHLPAVSSYGGWPGSGEQTPSRQRRKAASPLATESTPTAESDTESADPAATDPNRPGHVVDFQA